MRYMNRRKNGLQLKYFAIILILSVSFYIAFSIKRRGKSKLVLLSSLTQLVEYIKDQIEYFCAPTEEIFRNYCDGRLADFGFLPIRGTDDMISKLERLSSDGFLDSESREVLISFCKRLGRSIQDEQIANCEYTLSRLRKSLEEASVQLPRKTGVYSALTVVCGFMTAIILL